MCLVQQHVRHSPTVTILVNEMEAHHHTARNSTDAQRVDLGVQKVLHRVPAHGPAETGNVDHHDGGGAGGLLAAGEDAGLAFAQGRDGGQVGSDEAHGDGLKGDADAERAFATDDVDQEERADDGRDELDDSEDGGCEEFLVLSLGAEQGEEFGGVDGDALCTRPLRQQLREKTEVDSVEVVGHQEHLLEDTEPALAKRGFLLFVKLLLDLGDLLDDVLAVDGQVADPCEVLGCFVVLADLNEVAGRFVVEEGEDDDDACEHDVDGCWYDLVGVSGAMWERVG